MYLSTEDARSDFILVVAAVVLGHFAVSLLMAVPGYPSRGATLAGLLAVAWQVLLTGAAAYGLARYRSDVPGAFAMGAKDRGGGGVGIVVASPLLVAYLLPSVVGGNFGSLASSLAGRFTAGPTVGGFTFTVDTIITMVSVVVIAIGSWLFASFLVVRARNAFRSPDMDLTEIVRSFGIGGVGLTLVLGLLVSIRGFGVGNALRLSAALLVVVLLTDQYIPTRTTTTRATVIAPVIAVMVLYVLVAGGLFSGDLLVGLYAGVSAAVLMLCAAALAEARHGIATAILVVASVVYPLGFGIQPIPCGLVFC